MTLPPSADVQMATAALTSPVRKIRQHFRLQSGLIQATLALAVLLPTASLSAQLNNSVPAAATAATTTSPTGRISLPGDTARSENKGSPTSTPVIVNGEVDDIRLKGAALEVLYSNTGSVQTPISGELQVRDAQGELSASVSFAEAYRVEPGQQVSFLVKMPKLSPGNYKLYAVVDYGGHEMTAVQSALEVRN